MTIGEKNKTREMKAEEKLTISQWERILKALKPLVDAQSQLPKEGEEVWNKEAIELVKKHIPNNALAKDYILERLTRPTVSEEEIEKYAWNQAQEYTDFEDEQIEIHDNLVEGARWAVSKMSGQT